MSYKLMIQGTTNGSGKSFIIAGISRAFTELGFKVSPFKSLEITRDTFVTKEGAEISNQVAKLAFASKTEPSMFMNPVLLKPSSNGNFKVYVLGESIGQMTKDEFLEYKKTLFPKIEEAIKRLENRTDIILFEGDKNPSNLDQKEDDVSNMGLATKLNIPVLLTGDWSTGGAIASLYGTIDFLKYEEKRLIKGILINKYSEDYLKSDKGIKQLETRSGKEVIGKIQISDADPFVNESEGFDLGEKSSEDKKKSSVDKKPIDVAIIKLPRMTHSAEFSALEANDKFQVRYIKSAELLGTPELLIIPGTKSTIPDLRWFKAMGFGSAIKNLPTSTKIFGICGGLQMLGREVCDPNYVAGGGSEDGLGFLPVRSILNKNDVEKPIQMRLVDLPRSFQFLEKITIKGQMLNNSDTEVMAEEIDGRTYGTYVHGFFENEAVLKAFERGFSRLEAEENDFEKYREIQFDKCCNVVERALEMEELEIIMGMKKK